MSERDYGAPEQEEYANPYASTSYSSNMNEDNAYNNAYNNTQYSQRNYTNLGGVMVDEDGKPLTNNFGIKVFFSIVIILLCCCGGTTSAIIGIVALVFTCLANNAYHQGKMSEFKANARVSTVLLSLGGAFVVIVICAYIGLLSFVGSLAGEYEDLFNALYGDIYEGGFDYNWDDEDWFSTESTGTESYPGVNNVRLDDSFDDFVLNGTAYSIPMSYETFVGMGYTLEGFDSVTVDVFEAGEYENYNFSISDEYAGVVRISNNGDTSADITDCEVDFFCIYNVDTYDGAGSTGLSNMDMTILGDVSLASTYEELTAVLGTPYYIYADATGEYVTYRWEYNGQSEYQSLDVSFYDGVIYDVSIDHYEY